MPHESANAPVPHTPPHLDTPTSDLAPTGQDADEPGMGAVLSAGLIAASIFALVSMPVRFIFSQAFGGSFSWRGCAEILVVLVGSAIVYAVYGRQLRRL
jgi:hypothetical protein